MVIFLVLITTMGLKKMSHNDRSDIYLGTTQAIMSVLEYVAKVGRSV